MNIKHKVGEMKKTRNPNENRRGKTGQCPFIFSVQWRRCECNLLVGWAQGDSDHLCWDDNRENCSPWSAVVRSQARGSWSTRLISSYYITTQHIVHATGDSDYRRKFGIWVGGNMCLIIMKSQGFLYITLVVSSCNMQYRIRNASAWSKVGFISMYIVQYCECHKFLLIFIIIRINFCSD